MIAADLPFDARVLAYECDGYHVGYHRLGNRIVNDAHYSPEPMDTDAVDLPPHLLSLTEQLARHTHGVWAKQRIARISWART